MIIIRVPTLDERKEDIPELVQYFTAQICAESGKPLRTFSPEAVKALQAKSWPGNIRELRNVVERLLILGNEPVTAKDVSDYASA